MENGANTVKLSAGSGSTGTFDCIRPHISDILDFLADVYTLSKFKSTSRAMSPDPGFDEDNLIDTVKAGMVQLLTLEVVPFVEIAGIKNDLSVYMRWL
jgi:hypothetical protein